MKLDNGNLFNRLGIKTPETLTNQDIEDAYMDKLVELYMDKVKEEEKQSKEDEYKEEIYSKIKGLPSNRAKIMVMENWIEELGDTNNEQTNYKFQILAYRQAYDTLKDSANRLEYIRKTIGQKRIEYELMHLIERNGGDFSKPLKTNYANLGTNPLNVQERDIVEYDVVYDDEEISLSLKNTIMFESNMMEDELSEYLLLIKTAENGTQGCNIQGKIVFPELSNPEYRAALFQAILQSRKEGSEYFGRIGKQENEYIIIKDQAEELAIKEVKELEEQKRRENLQARDSGDDAR